MATWQQLRVDNRQAAQVLLEKGHVRSSICRSYYAAYSAITGELSGKVTFAAGRNNPRHAELVNFIRNNLPSLSENSRATYIGGRTLNEQEVIELVREQLGKHQPKGVVIDVVTEGVRQDGNWWYVPVRADKEFPRTSTYYEALTEIEDEIKAKLGGDLDVLLVPSS